MEIILEQPWGGLGDNLQFSTLPKLFASLGHTVYISRNNKYRNTETHDFVWGRNPYVSGCSDKPANAGACRGFQKITDNSMKNMELTHGLAHGTDKYPVVYYIPKKIPELEGCLLYDMTSISTAYSDEYIHRNFQEIFDKYPTLPRKKVVFSKIANRATPDLGTDVLEISSLEEYADAIHSCQVHVSVCSGSMVLASAIRQDHATPEIYCFHKHKKMGPGDIYYYDNVRMILRD